VLANGEAGESFLVPGSITLDLDVEGTGLAYPCVAMRARALNGELSARVTSCANEHPAHVIDSGDVQCTSAGLVWPDPGPGNRQLTLMAPDPPPEESEVPRELETASDTDPEVTMPSGSGPKPGSKSAQYGCSCGALVRAPWAQANGALLFALVGLVLALRRAGR
jgi:hypothetical protein